MDKKLSILYILKILEEETDESHPINQETLLMRLAQSDIFCERKTVARNLDWLQEAGYDIVRERNRIYLRVRKFTDEELLLLIDGVLANRYLCSSHTAELIGKLKSEGTPKLRKTSSCTDAATDWDKTENLEILLTIAVINDAVLQNRKINFVYNTYGTDRKLHPRKSERYIASPYRLLFHNQRYYLSCNLDGTSDVRYLRVDYMTDVVCDNQTLQRLASLGVENKFPAGRIACSFPYLFSDTPTDVTLEIEKDYVNDVIDWFGKKIAMKERDGVVTVRFKTSCNALRYWLLQYGMHARVLSPHSLVEQLRRDTEILYSKYHGEQS